MRLLAASVMCAIAEMWDPRGDALANTLCLPLHLCRGTSTEALSAHRCMMPVLFAASQLFGAVTCMLITLTLPAHYLETAHSIPLVSHIGNYAPERYVYAAHGLAGAAFGMVAVFDAFRWSTSVLKKARRYFRNQDTGWLTNILLTSMVAYIAQALGVVGMVSLCVQAMITLSDGAGVHAFMAKVAIACGIAFEVHVLGVAWLLTKMHPDSMYSFSYRVKLMLVLGMFGAMFAFPLLVLIFLQPENWWEHDTVDSWKEYVDAMGNIRPVLEWIVYICIITFFGTMSTDFSVAAQKYVPKDLIHRILLLGVLTSTSTYLCIRVAYSSWRL